MRRGLRRRDICRCGWWRRVRGRRRLIRRMLHLRGRHWCGCDRWLECRLGNRGGRRRVSLRCRGARRTRLGCLRKRRGRDRLCRRVRVRRLTRVLRLRGGRANLRAGRHARQRVNKTEGGGDRFDRLRDRGMRRGLCLKRLERRAHVVERRVRVRLELRSAASFDLMQCAHRLRDRRRELEEHRRDVRIGLQCVQPSRERLSRVSRCRNGVGHVFIS